MTNLEKQLEKLNNQYQTYYNKHRKHRAYAEVKEALALFKEQIAMLEMRIMRGEQ